MKSNRILFGALYGVGLLLVIGLFFMFIPPERRTPVAWLNLFIILLIVSGVLGKYSLLYPLQGRFAGRVPVLSAYWLAYGTYAVVALAAMGLFLLLGVGVGKQAMMQGIILFGFVCVVALGIGAGRHIDNDDTRIAESVDGMRAIQSRAAQLQAMLPGLASPHSLLANEAAPVLDELNYIGGCSGEAARRAEADIVHLLDVFLTQCQTAADLPECRKTLTALAAATNLRKTCRNA